MRDRQTTTLTDNQTDIQTYRHIGQLADTQTDRQTDNQTDRQKIGQLTD